MPRLQGGDGKQGAPGQPPGINTLITVPIRFTVR